MLEITDEQINHQLPTPESENTIADPFSGPPPTVDQTIEVAKIAAREAFADNPGKGKAPNRIRRFFTTHFGDKKKSQTPNPTEPASQSSSIKQTPRV